MRGGPLRDVLALAVGFVTGLPSALFGIGGAIISNPGLRALGAAPLVAVGTTLPSILPGAVSGTLHYRRPRPGPPPAAAHRRPGPVLPKLPRSDK
jgi:uncharacterized membrane protein YfcA